MDVLTFVREKTTSSSTTVPRFGSDRGERELGRALVGNYGVVLVQRHQLLAVLLVIWFKANTSHLIICVFVMFFVPCTPGLQAIRAQRAEAAVDLKHTSATDALFQGIC